MQQGAPFVPQKPLLPYPTKEESKRAGVDFYHCPDLFAKEAWYEHEFRMAAGGCRSYCTILLPLRGENIGCAVCCRALPVPFSDEEIGVLREVAQAFRVAVANALANEEISRLKDQLAAENLSLKEKLGSMPWFGEIVGDLARHAADSGNRGASRGHRRNRLHQRGNRDGQGVDRPSTASALGASGWPG